MSAGAVDVPGAYVDLYWLPLGAGGHCVRFNGRVYEAVLARARGRTPRDLYHCGLEVGLAGTRYVIEMGPVWNVPTPDRGVVVEGPVGTRWLGRSRAFRYEVRCWPGGSIPDADEAVDSPVRLSDRPGSAHRVLELVRRVPPLTWGRDELRTGEMWNSNALVSWLLARSGHDTAHVAPPPGGRAPGWAAGLVLAARERDGERAPRTPGAAVAQSTGDADRPGTAGRGAARLPAATVGRAERVHRRAAPGVQPAAHR